MTTPQELRRQRLVADFEEMRAIRGNVVEWTAGPGPYVERYQLLVRVRTIIGPAPNYRAETRLQLDIPATYPRAKPIVQALDRPFPHHPNFYDNGAWCSGAWAPTEGLGHFVLRLVRILQFDPSITNVNSPASLTNLSFWRQAVERGMFPSDRQILPDPNRKRTKITVRTTPVEPTPTNGGRTRTKITPR